MGLSKHLSESADRRFVFKNRRNTVIFNHDNRSKKITLNRLIAALSMTNNKLYQYLSLVDPGKTVKPYSKDEKSVIKNIVRLSRIPRLRIPCQKIRSLCRVT